MREFKNRAQAGRLLARALRHLRGEPGLIVLALPRGGVPVAHAVAKALGAPLDLLLVRKISLPGQEEYAIGAVGSGGVCVLAPADVDGALLSTHDIAQACAQAQAELARRERLYREGRAPLALGQCTAVLVDDGLATGASMRAAVEIARRLGAARIVVALPVGAPGSLAALEPLVDELVCLKAPPRFISVSQWYQDFEQTSDDEVRELLGR